MIELRPTTVVHAPRLSSKLNVELVVVSESFQHTGSFKFRAAHNLARKVEQKKLITASSGNFGQALAYACLLMGKVCLVVSGANVDPAVYLEILEPLVLSR